MSQTPFVGKTVYPSWGGQEPRVTVATPSWIAPPLPVPRFAACEAPPIRLSVLPEEGAHVHAPIAAAPAAPEPPAYPDLRLEHAAVEAECAALRIQLKATADAMVELRRRILEASEPEVVGLACADG